MFYQFGISSNLETLSRDNNNILKPANRLVFLLTMYNDVANRQFFADRKTRITYTKAHKTPTKI